MTIVALGSYAVLFFILVGLDERIDEHRLLLEIAAVIPLAALILLCRMTRPKDRGPG